MRLGGRAQTWGSTPQLLCATLLFTVLYLVRIPARPAIRLCGFYWLTGMPCPLCGLTRAIFALAKGHVRGAIALNALSPLGFVMLFALFRRGPAQFRIWTAGVAAFAIYGIGRVLFHAV